MRIVLMSTRLIGEKILEKLVGKGENIVAVGSTPVPEGVKDRMQEAAIRLKLPFFQVKQVNSEEFLEQYRKWNADLNILAGLRAFLPEAILRFPKLGTIGWHPSLLPKYAGVNSICWPIIFGEKKTANTLFWTDKGIDSGPILMQKEVVISKDDTLGSLYAKKILPQAVEMVSEAVDLVKSGNPPRIPQDLNQYSYYSFITEKDIKINWVQPGKRIYDLIRGTNPFPGAETNFNNIKFKVLDSELKIGFAAFPVMNKIITGAVKAGDVIEISNDGINVLVPDGTLLIKKVIFEGAQMNAAEFATKVDIKTNSRLGDR